MNHMSENEKPLSQRVSENMAALLHEDRSIFTKPTKEDGTSQFITPINARTKQPYRGAAALVLMMQNRRDPRWLTYEQAKFNRTPVKRGGMGVVIEFNSTRDLRQKTQNGQPVMKENGTPKMERVKLEEPVTVQAKMFNGKDLMNLKAGEVTPHEQTPVERAQNIIENSQVKFEHNAIVPTYDPTKDVVFMPAKDKFDRPELYYAAALRELAMATGHEGRMNRALEELHEPEQFARESLRTNIAAIMLSAQLNLPYELGNHAVLTHDWANLMTEKPQELFDAANEAQQIADYVMSYERQPAIKQEVSQEQKQTPAGKLQEGQEIPYKNTTYQVVEKQSKGSFKIKDMTTQQAIRITPSMGLYKALVNQLNNTDQVEKLSRPQGQAQVQDRSTQKEDQANIQGQEKTQQNEISVNEGEDNTISRGRKR